MFSLELLSSSILAYSFAFSFTVFEILGIDDVSPTIFSLMFFILISSGIISSYANPFIDLQNSMNYAGTEIFSNGIMFINCMLFISYQTLVIEAPDATHTARLVYSEATIALPTAFYVA